MEKISEGATCGPEKRFFFYGKILSGKILKMIYIFRILYPKNPEMGPLRLRKTEFLDVKIRERVLVKKSFFFEKSHSAEKNPKGDL